VSPCYRFTADPTCKISKRCLGYLGASWPVLSTGYDSACDHDIKFMLSIYMPVLEALRTDTKGRTLTNGVGGRCAAITPYPHILLCVLSA
jgi:hypothetical protein